MKRPKTELVVIGGGAAGMMAAITASMSGAEVVLLERNDRLGRKLLITGKGRCNLTNNCDIQQVISNIPRNGKFMYSSLKAFDSAAAMRFFESIGVPLKTERGNRVFPASDKAADVVGALERKLREQGVRVIKARASELISENGRITGIRTDRGEIMCLAAIICTGGVSYPKTGSTGDGYRMAEMAGHTVIPPRPSLVPLESPDLFCAEMQGFSLKNVALSLWGEKSGKLYEDFGEMQFTHFGISGPMVLSASAHLKRESDEKYYVQLDLKPALDDRQLDARILRDFEEFSNRNFSNALDKLAGRLMIPVLVERSGIPPGTKVNSITKRQRAALVRLFKEFRIDIAGPRPVEEAVVTSGGVSVKEINPATMESRLISGLYFAGEVIDCDAYTGGFNLQIAWSTGHAAGKHAAEKTAEGGFIE